jgi:hypothetical protein
MDCIGLGGFYQRYGKGEEGGKGREGEKEIYTMGSFVPFFPLLHSPSL